MPTPPPISLGGSSSSSSNSSSSSTTTIQPGSDSPITNLTGQDLWVFLATYLPHLLPPVNTFEGGPIQSTISLMSTGVSGTNIEWSDSGATIYSSPSQVVIPSLNTSAITFGVPGTFLLATQNSNITQLTLTQALNQLAASGNGFLLTASGNSWIALAPGSSGQVLTSTGSSTPLVWTTPATGSSSTSVYRAYAFNSAEGAIGTAWTNMANVARSAAQPLYNASGSILRANLAGCTQARSCINVAVTGAASAMIGFQFSLNGTSWSFLEDTASGLDLSANAIGFKTSSWMTISTSAMVDDLWLRAVGFRGDGAADPKFGIIQLEFKS